MQWQCSEIEGVTSCATVLDDDPITYLRDHQEVFVPFALIVIVALGLIVGIKVSSRN